MAEAASDQDKGRARARRPWWRRKRWWLLALVLGGLVWLDGPGWRWIGSKAGSHFLGKLGIEGGFVPSGRLSGGKIGIHDLGLSGRQGVQLVGLDDIAVEYRLSEVIRGKVERLAIDELHVEIDLAAFPPKEETSEEEPAKEPGDPVALIRSIRERVVPVEIEVRRLSATIRRGEELLFRIEPSGLTHAAGSPDLRLGLGAMEFVGGRRLDAQQVTLGWYEERITLDQLRVLDELAIRDVEVRAADVASLEGDAMLQVVDSVFAVSGDLDSATVEQQGAALEAAQVAELLQIELPLAARLERLELEVTGYDRGLAGLNAEVQAGLGGIDYDGWTSSRIALAARLEENTARVALEGEALGSPLELVADAAIQRNDETGLLPERAELRLGIGEIAPALTVVRDRFTPAPPAEDMAEETPDSEETSEPPAPRPNPPQGTLQLTGQADFAGGWVPSQAEANLALDASAEEAPDLALDASWQGEDGIDARLSLAGVDLDGSFDPAARQYRAALAAADFRPAVLDPWLAPFGVELPAALQLSARLEGEGDLAEARHSGAVDLERLEWTLQPEQPPLLAFSSIRYDWPERVELEALNVQLGAQKIEADALLADQRLELRELSWSDGDEALLSGHAEIPVPDPIGDWKALLRDERPIRFDLETPELPLSKLHPFLPEEQRFPESSRASLTIDLEGSPAAPVLDARLEGRAIGLLSQPDLPPIDLKLEAVGREETLKLEGLIEAPDYPPAVISAVTNWDPDHWAEEPETIRQAPLDASLRLADLDLSLFAKFLTEARRLEGLLDVDVEVTGTMAEPKPLGTVTLEGARFEMDDPGIPRVKDGRLRLVAEPAEVRLEELSAGVSGGTLTGSGRVALENWKPVEIRLDLDGASLPVMRNEQLIMRANADLNLSGPWESARLAGSIGIVDSVFFKDIELIPIGVPTTRVDKPSLPSVDAPSPSELTAKVPEPFRDWGLNLALYTHNPLLIRGNIATGEVFLKAQVQGSIANPRPSGGATLREITAELPFSSLHIEEGSVNLRPGQPFNPGLDIRGRSVVRPYEIDVYVYGSATKPKILMTSNPPLPDTEIMTLLATGTTTEGFEDPDAATARAAQLFIEEIRRGRISSVRWMQPVLSVLDKVDFQLGAKDPYTSTKYNSATVNLSDSWLLRAGLSEEGYTRGSVVYLLRFK